MNHTAAEILRACLVALDPPLFVLPEDLQGSDPPYSIIMPSPWPAFVSSMPIDGDFAVCVYDTMGKNDGRTMKNGVRTMHPGVSIRIRAKDYGTGVDRGLLLAQTLDEGITNFSVTIKDADGKNDYVIENCTRTTNLIYLNEEPERRRLLWTLNAILTIDGSIAF